MNNESIQRLREPAAWALLGATAAVLLGALIHIFGGPGPDTSARFADVGGSVIGPGTVALILAAVALVLTAPNRSPRTFGIVMMAIIELGVGALLGVISLIMGFVAYGDLNLAGAFQHFFTIGAYLTVAVFAGIFLIRAFNDPNLVPRATASSYPSGTQQAFNQQQTPGYVTGAQQSAGQAGAWQQSQTGAGAEAQQAVSGYDQSAYGQQQYRQGYEQQQAAGYSQTGGQQAVSGYDQSAYGQQQYQQGYEQQQAAGYSQTGGQQAVSGYDQSAYGQQQYQQGGYSASDSEATLVQPAVSDPATGAHAVSDGARAEERAAQEAIQHGWSQPAPGAADSASGGNQPYADPGQYGTGGYPASSGGYSSEQQSGAETGDPWSG